MKINQTNEELFDGLFKQDLGNAQSAVPSGAWEGISSSLGSGAATAGMAVKSAIWMKAAISVAVVSSIAVVTYFSQSKEEIKPVEVKVEKEIPAPTAANPIPEVKVESTPLLLESQKTKKEDIVLYDVPPPEWVYPDSDPMLYIPSNHDNTLSQGEVHANDRTETKEPSNELVAETEAAAENVTQADASSMKDSSYIEVPDAFTADGDGINDTYLIKLIGEEKVEIIIYTADNQVIFRTNNKYVAWNAKLPNGENAPEGFYFVKVVYKFKNKVESKPIITRLTLIR